MQNIFNIFFNMSCYNIIQVCNDSNNKYNNDFIKNQIYRIYIVYYIYLCLLIIYKYYKTRVLV